MAAQALPGSSLKSFPAFKPGDTVRMHLKVVEGDSERTQIFEGTVISRRGAGVSETVTVRKISFGVGVERIFPLHSPRIERIERVRPGRVRRARLYYLRGLSGRAARLDEDSKPGPKPAAAGIGEKPEESKAAAAKLDASPAPITT